MLEKEPEPLKSDKEEAGIDVAHFDHEGASVSMVEGKVEPMLAKGLRMMALNGSTYRTITSNRPTIDTPLIDPKKGNGQHKIKDTFGKKAYQHNDALTTAFILLKEKGAATRKDALFITVTLDDETNLKLRKQDKDVNKETMIRTVSRWFRAYNYMTDAIVVIEECPVSVVKHENDTYRRLHLHIVTTLNENERRMAEVGLLKDKCQQIQVKDTWLHRRPYTSDDEWEEEDFGPIPIDSIDPGAEYWLNAFVEEKVSRATGEVYKEVCREFPVCLRGVDYMSKGIQKSIGRGNNYTLIGLEGYRERRSELSRLARELLAE
ncbi:hypothetical protein [Vibrio sp. VB16]|uniref:hypothetical protein n=1 Tax=Vibrio sp. VB16 TaxID=2785746 RepID=UPI00189EB820|nr:hypothetical protein [Vibrio sp. VB16]UGA55422.1 hypothetical protein IUZ65_003445 [Vibrio sp. VB16]